MSGYVPTIEVVKDACTFPRRRLGEPRDMTPEAFDRWLASVKADVWDESMHAMVEAWGWPPGSHSGPNPYRDEADA